MPVQASTQKVAELEQAQQQLQATLGSRDEEVAAVKQRNAASQAEAERLTTQLLQSQVSHADAGSHDVGMIVFSDVRTDSYGFISTRLFLLHYPEWFIALSKAHADRECCASTGQVIALGAMKRRGSQGCILQEIAPWRRLQVLVSGHGNGYCCCHHYDVSCSSSPATDLRATTVGVVQRTTR